MLESLVCPKCKNNLNKNHDFLYCENCKKTYDINKGICNFLDDIEIQCSEIGIDDINKLLRNAEKNGWRASVRDIGFKYPYMNDIFLDNSQVDWLFHCLDLTNTNSCLELGSCWGTTAFCLSKYFNEVWSVDSVIQRLEYQKIKQEQEKIHNMKFCRASSLHLPFKDNCFNLVATKNYLEGLIQEDYKKKPRYVHQLFLKEIRRVLKPGGCLYMGSQNSIKFSSFFRKKNYDLLSITYSLPQEKINIQSKGFFLDGKKQKQFQFFNYNFYEYKNIIKEIGFKNIEIYWTMDHNRPSLSGKFDGENFRFVIKNTLLTPTHNKLFKFLILSISSYLPSIIIKHTLPFITPNFLIYAYKDFKKPTFEDKLIKLEKQYSSFLRRSGSRGYESKEIYFLFKNGIPQSLVKFPRFDGFYPLSMEEEKMSRFNKIDIKRKQIDSVIIFIEPFIKGNFINYYNMSHNKAVLDWLIDFQQKTQQGFWDFNQFKKNVEILKQQLPEIPITPEIESRIQENLKHFFITLSKTKLTQNSEHGDFAAVNIIIDNEEKVYVTDWEFYKEKGDPLFDFVFFILSSAYDIKPFPQAFMDAFSGTGKYSKILNNLISDFCKKKQLPVELIYQSVPYVLLKCIHRTTFAEDRKHFDSNLYIKLLETWYKIDFSHLIK